MNVGVALMALIGVKVPKTVALTAITIRMVLLATPIPNT